MSETDGNKLKDSENLKMDVKDKMLRSSFNLFSYDNENDDKDKKINSYCFENETPGFYEPSREESKKMILTIKLQLIEFIILLNLNM